MGQRHQIFVIARVGKHYRSLAVIHHQDLYDCIALSACLRLISIFSDKANRRPLEMELRLAAEFYKDPENLKTDGGISWGTIRDRPVQFPFIGTCLVLGASTAGLDPDFPRSSTVHFEPEDLGFDKGDNNTGITVLDITNLDNVRYCFAAWRRVGWRWDLDSDVAELGPAPPLNAPWSGAEYGRHYQGYYVPFDSTRDRLATKLAEFPLVSVSALADVWPWGKWVMDQSPEMDKAGDDPLKHTGGASLRDQALAKLVQSMLSSPQEDMGLLNEPMRFPGFQAAFRDHLFAVKEELPKSPAAPALLRTAWAGETVLDWSRFYGLSPENIVAALQGPELKGARELSLCPDWSSTTPLALAQAICSFPRLQDLFVLAPPGRSQEGPIGELYMALASDPGCPTGRIFLSDAASCAIKQRLWLPTTDAFSPPSSFPIQQLLVIPSPRLLPIEDRSTVPPVYYFHLADAFLTPTRCVNGILSLLACHMAYGSQESTVWSLSVSHLFACAAPTFSDPSAIEVSPIPAETFTIAKRVYHRPIKNCFAKMRDLDPSTWTALVDLSGDREPEHLADTTTMLFPPPQKSFKCAFVRPRNKVIKAEPLSSNLLGPDDLEVLGAEDFLRATAPDADIDSLYRRFEHLECRATALSRHQTPPNPPNISRTPMDAQTACELLKQAFDYLPTVHTAYQQAMFQQEPSSDRFWYPELGLQPAAAAPFYFESYD